MLRDCLMASAGFNAGVAAFSVSVGFPFYAVGGAIAAVLCVVMARVVALGG